MWKIIESFLKSFSSTINVKNVENDDIVMTLGAGTVTEIGSMLVE